MNDSSEPWNDTYQRDGDTESLLRGLETSGGLTDDERRARSGYTRAGASGCVYWSECRQDVCPAGIRPASIQLSSNRRTDSRPRTGIRNAAP
jgi:hypothetical protein